MGIFKLNNQVTCKAKQQNHLSIIPFRSTVWRYATDHNWQTGNEPENTPIWSKIHDFYVFSCSLFMELRCDITDYTAIFVSVCPWETIV